MSISVIVPSYKNPEYLAFCLSSLLTNQKQKNEILVVLDGYKEMYGALMETYSKGVRWLWLDENQGLPMATNVGVFNATNEKILIINEDNVAPQSWDARLESVWESGTIYAVQQIEPTRSIFKFNILDCGREPSTFDQKKFADAELSFATLATQKMTDDAYTLPIFMSKKWYMAVNGWDVSYQSPFVVDLDFFLKLQLIWTLEFKRTHVCAFYHFGSKSTKNRTDGDTAQWSEGEEFAAQQFKYKWGIAPGRLQNNRVYMEGLVGVK